MKGRKKLYLGVGILAVLVIAVLVLTKGGEEVATVLVQQGSITRTVADTG